MQDSPEDSLPSPDEAHPEVLRAEDDGWIEVTPATRPPRTAGERGGAMPSRRGFPLVPVLLLVPVLAGAGWWLGQHAGSAHRGGDDPGAQPAATQAEAAPSPLSAIEVPPRLIEHEDAAAVATLGKPSRWLTSIADAEAESRRTGKPILVDFNAAWCGPCRAMREQVFDDATNGDLVRRLVVPVSIVDRSREDGENSAETEELLQSYSIEAFPTLIVYRPGGTRTLRATGFGGAAATVDWIRGAVKAAR